MKENAFFCDKNDIGDEFHYILVCPYLRTFRNRFVKVEYRTNVNIIKFKQLFQSVNISTLRKSLKLILQLINYITSPPFT